MVYQLLITKVIKEKKNTDLLISKEYYKFIDIFSKAKANKLLLY
jgi:hypothetical protein